MRKISVLYTAPFHISSAQIKKAIDRGCKEFSNPHLFFRADDIGAPSDKFNQLIALFKKHSLPLCLATVPAWLTETRAEILFKTTGTSDQWCWHQHGRVHRNFETSGKNQEFGPARPKEVISKQLQLGNARLANLLGDQLQPYFTPPWNRCSEDTLVALSEQGFKAISRSKNARPEAHKALPDFAVNVDLHTRKELTAEHAFNSILTEIENALASGCCGIMIHHQCMNDRAFMLLDTLLGLINDFKQIKPVTFKDIPVSQ